jgi:Matrixin
MAHFETLAGRRSGDGLDPTERPPMLLVSVRTPKRLRLRDAANWSLSAPRHGLVSVAADGPPNSTDRPITVTAWGEDMTTIEARSSDGRQALYLTVYTRPSQEVTIAFYLMRDSGGHATRRTEAEAGQILQRLNEIYEPQTNITFAQVDLQTITVSQDLGRNIDLPRRGQGAGAEFTAIEQATEAMRAMGVRALSAANHARVRVHFVWSLRRAATSDDLEGSSRIGGNTLLVEDRLAANVGTVVAHEVGHCLGLDHPGAQRGWLMFPTTRGLGTTIPKRHVDILNPETRYTQ